MTMLRRLTALLIALSLGMLVPLQSVQATLIGTDELARNLAGNDAERERIAAGLARPEIAAALARMGVDPAGAQARAAALTDAEVARLAQVLDTAPAGGDFLGAALFVFFVVLVLDILGFTKILPFTRPLR